MSYADFKRTEVIATKFVIRHVGGQSLGVTLNRNLVELLKIKENDYFVPRVTRKKGSKEPKLILEYLSKEEAQKDILEGW